MMAWLRKLSWKWKLTALFILGFFFLLVFILTPWGQDIMRAKIEQKFDEMPVSEQRDSPWADRYVTLAWFRGHILGHTEVSIEMYKHFLGIDDDTPYTTYKLKGLCSADGKTGWGPLHPRAPEAFYGIIDLMYNETNMSNEKLSEKCWQYYLLLYDFARFKSDDHKPNKNFKMYWTKVNEIGKKFPYNRPESLDRNAPLAPNVEPDGSAP